MRGAILGLILAAGLAAGAAAPAAAQLPVTPPPEEEGEEQRRDPPPVTPAGDPGPEWIVEGGDAARRFWAGESGVAPPLEVRWTASVAPGAPADILVAGGLVIVGVSERLLVTSIVAFDAATGARRWQVDGLPHVGDLAIAAGKVVAAQGRELHAYDLQSGARAWSLPIASGPLAPSGNDVFFWGYHDSDGDGGSNPRVRLHAVDAATGQERWRTEEESSDPPHGRVLVSGERLYHPTICETTAHDRRDGAEIWRQGPSCSGGWQNENALVGDRVIASGRVLAMADGSVVRDSFPRSNVIAGDRVIAETDDEQFLAALDVNTLGELWRWTEGPNTYASGAGVGAAGDRVWVQRAEHLALLDRLSGGQQWQGVLRGASGSSPIVAGGLALARRANDIVALGPAGTRPPAVGLKASERTVEYGEDLRLDVTVGYPELTMAGPATVQFDEFPAGGFAPGPGLTTTPAGTGSIAVRPSRLTAYRVEAQGGVSEAHAVTVVPRIRLRPLLTRRGRVRLRVVVQVPPDAQLRRRVVGLYVARRGGRRYERLGVGRLRGRAGRFSAVLTARRTELRPRDFTTVCIRGLNRYGLGYGDRLERRCGHRRVRGSATASAASVRRPGASFSRAAGRAARASRGTRSRRATP